MGKAIFCLLSRKAKAPRRDPRESSPNLAGVDVEQGAEPAAHFLPLERICTQFAVAKMALKQRLISAPSRRNSIAAVTDNPIPN